MNFENIFLIGKVCVMNTYHDDRFFEKVNCLQVDRFLRTQLCPSETVAGVGSSVTLQVSAHQLATSEFSEIFVIAVSGMFPNRDYHSRFVPAISGRGYREEVIVKRPSRGPSIIDVYCVVTGMIYIQYSIVEAR